MPTISPDLLARFSMVVSERTGLAFPRERWKDLERGLASAAGDFGFRSPEDVVEWFLSADPPPKAHEILAGHLTVGETCFFRDAKSFLALEHHIFPALIASRRPEKRLRIWSAGCCTGEEPYSLAILLQSLLPDIREWRITLLATDINHRFLRKATEGIYSEWSFRNTPAWVRQRFFARREDGRYQIGDSLRSMVTFAPMNLVDDSYPSFVTNTNAMDLILCRNVLMYFSPAHAKNVVRKLFRSLVSSGWLLVSPSEMSRELFPDFEPVELSGALCYRKIAKEAETALRESPDPLTVPPLDRRITGESDVPTIPFPKEELPPKDSDRQPQEEQGTPEEAYDHILRLYERGDSGEAMKRVRAVLSTQPDHAALLALSARILAGSGNLNEAEEQCRKAIASDKLNAAHRYFHAVILCEQGRDDDAIIALQAALYADPKFPLPSFLLGHLADRKGKRQEAEKHYRRALHLLAPYRYDELVPESEGMSAGRLREVIVSILEQRRAS
ncbi:MAG: protein-glutamate O-methyltransferase [Bacteroidia bacterium]|nr:MAG: protein-glutamate O-methyltransferase [Bacteroidia bacterium]